MDARAPIESPVPPTADLCDAHGEQIQVIPVAFRHFGTVPTFAGPIHTVKCHEDNSLVKAAVSSPGEGRVLVVDGGGSLRCALVGDRLAGLAITHGWAGVVVWGAIRDSAEINTLSVGIRALGTCPRRSVKRGVGLRGEPISIGGVQMEEGMWLYADADGIIVAPERLSLPS